MFPIFFSVAWTDYPSTQSVSINLVNDLDLEVVNVSDRYFHYGNEDLRKLHDPRLREVNSVPLFHWRVFDVDFCCDGCLFWGLECFAGAQTTRK